MIDGENIFFVITTINQPTKGILGFSNLSKNKVIVVGDRKTPLPWESDNVIFWGLDEQHDSEFSMSRAIPENHYGRKMMGYLLAMKMGATIIVDTDDDNEPKSNWEIPVFEAEYDNIPSGLGSINIYSHYTDQTIWPRGLPLKSILNPVSFKDTVEPKFSKVGIWQGLADGDPDVDAVYRLTNGRMCNFYDRDPIVLGTGTISPFNSQNTVFRKELFPLLYLPSFVTFRFTDILRGLVAQPIMWLYGYTLGFTKATVVQERNDHDYVEDFISEIPMYMYGYSIIDIVSKSISVNNDIISNLFNAYHELHKHKIVSDDELKLLDYWLESVSSFISYPGR